MKLDGFHDASDFLRAGVYALVKNGVVIYVGKSRKMISRINSHRSIWAARRKGQKIPDWLPIPGVLFDEVHIRTCRLEDLDSLERAMIDRYRPKFNTLLKPEGAIPLHHLLAGIVAQTTAAPQPLNRRI